MQGFSNVQLPDMHIYITQLAKMSFDEIFDLTAGVYFNFYNIYIYIYLGEWRSRMSSNVLAIQVLQVAIAFPKYLSAVHLAHGIVCRCRASQVCQSRPLSKAWNFSSENTVEKLRDAPHTRTTNSANSAVQVPPLLFWELYLLR